MGVQFHSCPWLPSHVPWPVPAVSHSFPSGRIGFWFFLTTPRMFVSQPFCLLFLKYSHLPFHLKKKQKTKKLQIYKKIWKNSTVDTHVHLDSLINTFYICFIFLPSSFLARINIKWLFLFVCSLNHFRVICKHSDISPQNTREKKNKIN